MTRYYFWRPFSRGADRGWNGESRRLDAGVTATGYSDYSELKLTLC